MLLLHNTSQLKNTCPVQFGSGSLTSLAGPALRARARLANFHGQGTWLPPAWLSGHEDLIKPCKPGWNTNMQIVSSNEQSL